MPPAKAVVLTFASDKLVLSPDPAEPFVQALKQRLATR